MTPERATEIIATAKESAVGVPWADRLQHIMSIDERRELLAIWKTMPGSTSFIDVLHRVAKGESNP